MDKQKLVFSSFPFISYLGHSHKIRPENTKEMFPFHYSAQPSYLRVIFRAADLVLLLSALTDYLRNVVIQLNVVGAGVIKII